MIYYRSYPILLSAVLASIIVLGNLGQVFDSVYAQYQEKSGYPTYPYPVLHKIDMSVHKIAKPGGGGDLFAYKVDQHQLFDPKTKELLNDVTERYSKEATIPGPTLLVEEGDSVEVTFTNKLDSETCERCMVSIHIHGIHYSIASDGTLKVLNGFGDEGVMPGQSIKYHWTAGPGTAGSWPYHDHTLGLGLGHSEHPGSNMNGAETIGLFGTMIIDKHTGKTVALIDDKPTEIDIKDISKDVACYLTDDAFWCDEIDYRNNAIRTPLWENPTIGLKDGELIRFNLIAIGTDFHKFVLTGYQWLQPGTNQVISEKRFAPLENHVFTIQGKNGIAEYRDVITSHLLSGMKGAFVVDNIGQSIPGKHP
jgi:FtsP/CotA-like multicopper oxidase with cupredoxin domain